MATTQPSGEYIQKYALHLAAVSYGSNIIAAADIGMQLFMCIHGLSSFLTTPVERRKKRLPYIILSFSILILSTIPACLDLAQDFRVSYYSSPHTEYLAEKRKALSSGQTAASRCLLLAYVALGDGLLLYRCYILWQHIAKWVVTLPILVYLGFIGVSLTTLVHVLTNDLLHSENEVTKTQQLQIAYIFLSVTLNVIATSLISYKILVAKRSFSKALPSRNMRVYSAVARLVIESALPLTLSGLLCAIFTAINWAHYQSPLGRPSLTIMATADTFGSLYYTFAALSPQMIIFRVTTGRSHADNGDFQSSLDRSMY
ncbi:hypothetical protein CC2G_004473 [Coprinopsis cinerea AmutBmut pab1-1]|nr:hypothetical protein CC2G_004473 [Coprinopsis cinerea AmutBmut pab1-1]